MPKNQSKTCFVLAPIGEEASDTRERSDRVLRHIIKPVAEECGYRALRADEISEPGMITAQVIQHVVDDPMVVADLTDWNPNVFYELALRHALSKPTVHIIEAGQKIPFDVAGTRTIQVDYRNLDSVEACRQELAKQIKAVEGDPSLVDNPISVSVELQSLRQSANPLEKSNAEIISMLQEIRAVVSGLPSRARTVPDRAFLKVSLEIERLRSVLLDELSAAVEPSHKDRAQRAVAIASGLSRSFSELDASYRLSDSARTWYRAGREDEQEEQPYDHA